MLPVLFAILSIFPEAAPLFVFLGQIQLHSLRDRPFNTDFRIIPCKSALIIRMIKVSAFVAELGVV